MLERLAHDVRYAMRFVRRSPGFALTAIAVLALGIGANTAIFSVAREVLLRPLPYPEPDRLVQYVSRTQTGLAALTSVPKYNAWRQGIRVHEHVAAYFGHGPGVTLTTRDGREQVPAMYVTADYFRVFRAPVAFGRTFRGAEDYPQGPRLAVVSYDFALRQFGGGRNPVGSVLTLGDGAYEIIGVLGSAFRSKPHADVWLPLQAPAVSFDHTNYLTVVARLKRNVTIEMADVQARNTSRSFRSVFPMAMVPYEEFGAEPLARMVAGDTRPALQMLTAAVVFVLLIACANAANLFVARATRRRTDLATRAALGAGRARLIRQLFTECLLLAVAGGLIGSLLGFVGIRALVANVPDALASSVHVTADSQVLLFTLGMSVLTAIAFGLLPVLGASRVDLTSLIKEGAEGTTVPGQHRRQSLLVVIEITLALVLLAGAGLLVRTFVAQRTVDRGFRTTGLVAMEMPLNDGSFATADALDGVVRDVERRVDGIPGVRGIAAAYALPLQSTLSLPFVLLDRALLLAPYHGVGSFAPVSHAYFELLGISLVRGRTFNENDIQSAEPVVIINRSMARRFWQDHDPLGATLVIGRIAGREFDDRRRTIVGVVADVRDLGANAHPEPAMYVPIAQTTDLMMARNNRFFPLTWIVRTEADGAVLRAGIERELRAASGGRPIARVRRIEDIVRAATAALEFMAILASVFAAAALVLAAIGLYGLMSYAVQQRRREIGIRLALGAGPAALRNMVLAESGRLTATGVILGLAAAVATTRLMGSRIVGFAGLDVAVFAGSAALLAVVALAAACLPAHRATETDPLEALRR